MKSLDQMLMSISSKIKQKECKKIEYNSNKKYSERDISKNSVTKSNALVRSYYRFTLVEKRIMECLISQLNPMSRNLVENENLELKALDYANTFQVNPNHAYIQLSCAVKGLMHKVFSIENDKKREEYTLMASASYIEEEGRILCNFNPYILHHLINLRDKFTKYPLKNAVEFKSSYTWRMYEILVSWSKDKKITGGVFAGWFTINVEDLRKMLGVPDSYNFGMFNTQVINPTKKELLEKPNIGIKIEKIKNVREVKSLKFTFAEVTTIK